VKVKLFVVSIAFFILKKIKKKNFLIYTNKCNSANVIQLNLVDQDRVKYSGYTAASDY